MKSLPIPLTFKSVSLNEGGVGGGGVMGVVFFLQETCIKTIRRKR